jgi:dTDP-4-dehydrorhamnose reductase
LIERWLVTGASGQLGGHILRTLECRGRNAAVLALTRGREIAVSAPSLTVDLADVTGLRAAVRGFRPTHVLHVAAMTAVSECFADRENAQILNTAATRVLAEAASECAARFIFSSTDMVFDGFAAPYCEADEPRPLSVYGQTKRDAELTLLSMPGTLVVRIPLLYGVPCSPRPTTFVDQVAALRRRDPLKLFIDEIRTPVALSDAAEALIALARSDLTGVIHIAGPQRLSRFELVRLIAERLDIASPVLEPVSRLSIQAAEPRPADLSLDGRRFLSAFPKWAPRAVLEAIL